MGFSINGVTALGGEGQSFCDERSIALAIKSVTMEGVSKLCEIPWLNLWTTPNIRLAFLYSDESR